jgi:hypothetical protein
MPPSTRPRGWAPWIVAGVAGAVLVALLVVYFVVFLPYRRDHAVGQLSSRELDAMAAATTELDNIGALGGKNFDQNYDRALAGATGSLKSDLQKERSQAKKALAGNGVQAQVTQRALVGPAQGNGGAAGYQLLMNLAGPQTSVTSVLLAPQQVLVTVVQQGNAWLVSDVRSAGITS